jgi:hypothetical protein
MLLKNLATGDSLSLPDDLIWTDEHGWSPAVSSVSYLLTGALIVQSATRLAGRPVTLVGAADMAWIARATLNTLYAWAGIPLSSNSGRLELTLTDGRVLQVAFRHQDTPIEAEPVLGIPARNDADYYRITLRFMQLP